MPDKVNAPAVSQLAGEIAEKIDDYLVDAWGYATVQFKQKCESIISAALSEREEKVANALKILKEILGRFPAADTIEAIKADCGYGHRVYGVQPVPTDAEIVKWRAALSALGESKG